MTYKKNYFLTLVLLFVALVAAADGYRTESLTPRVQTLLVYPQGKPLDLPIINLEEGAPIMIAFDEMTFAPKNFDYKIIHCDANWQRSGLSEVEYLKGFATNDIFDYALSQNTTSLYTNYQFLLPNEDVQFLVSGNYAVLIAQDNDFDNPLAVACFSVVEKKVTIEASVSGNTDTELNGRFQQLEFEILHPSYQIRDPFSELTVHVSQNRRTDNEVVGIRPSYTAIGKQTYKNNKALIFEGGNQYRTIDFSSRYTYGAGIERIDYDQDVYQVILSTASSRLGMSSPTSGPDADGRFIINRQQSHNSEIEAEYMWVHFTYAAEKPLLDGSLYLLGDLCQNQLDDNARLEYDYQNKVYHKSLLLKQGGYSFQYAFLPQDSTIATLQKTEGSYWQTENQYVIYVYHRAWGERYDRLIGYLIINS